MTYWEGPTPSQAPFKMTLLEMAPSLEMTVFSYRMGEVESA